MIKQLTKMLMVLALLMFTRVEIVNAYQSGADRQSWKAKSYSSSGKSYSSKSYSSRKKSSSNKRSKSKRDDFNSAYNSIYSSKKSNYYRPINTQYAQSDKGRKSKSQVISEVKSRYDAQVLKVSLSSNGRNYNVRVLMPNGKVKNIKVSALR